MATITTIAKMNKEELQKQLNKERVKIKRSESTISLLKQLLIAKDAQNNSGGERSYGQP